MAETDGQDAHQSEIALARKLTGDAVSAEFAGVVFGSNSLEIPDDMAYTTWEELVRMLVMAGDALAWWIGDALAYGEQHYGEKYAQAVDATGMAVQTLKNYNYVSAAVAAERRDNGLSHSHHAEVASMPPHKQSATLKAAREKGMSVRALRQHVAQEQGRRFGPCPMCGGNCELLKTGATITYQPTR